MERLDLHALSTREINQRLHDPNLPPGARFEILHPEGLHNLAVGVDAPVDITIRGHVGYFVGGMNQHATITVEGNAGWSVAENMMSGHVRIKGFCSECAGASAHGGLLIIDGDASSRCGISLKGASIVVGGSVGHMSAFMAQAGVMLVCGDAGGGLGDSLYEAVIYIRGKIHGLGADAREEPLDASDLQTIQNLLDAAGYVYAPAEFKRIASARTLYHWSPESKYVIA